MTSATDNEKSMPGGIEDNELLSREEAPADEVQAAPAAPSAPPAPPPKSFRLSAAYVCASALLWMTQGLGMNLIGVNIPQLQGGLGATTVETTWLLAAYMAPNVSLTLFLMKIRTQYGLRRFTELGLLVFVLASLLHFFVHDLHSAVVVRFLAGMAASPLSTLGFFYMLEAFPPEKKMSWGLSLALTCTTLASPLARIISPALLDIGLWHQLYILELGLAMMSLAAVYMLPLTPIPHQKVLQPLDFISYPLIAIGFGILAVVLVLGRLYWWFEAPWIGVSLAVAALSISIAAAIELNRETPLINVRWLTSRSTLHFAAVLLIFRIVLSEQATGATGLFQALGLLNDQTRILYAVIMLASIAGGIACALVIKPGRDAQIHVVALSLVIIGAYMDGHATNLTRPAQMFLSQSMIAFGGALFLPPAMATGLMNALKNGPTYITSFIVVFIFTQSIGGLMGSALFGTFVTIRQKFHSSYLVEHVVLTDPVVAQRIAQLSAAYGRVLTDGRLLNAEGAALLAQQATRESTVLAYNDAFLLISAIAALALAALIVHVLFNILSERFAARPAPLAA